MRELLIMVNLNGLLTTSNTHLLMQLFYFTLPLIPVGIHLLARGHSKIMRYGGMATLMTILMILFANIVVTDLH